MRKLAAAPTWVLLGGLVALSTILRSIAALDVSTPIIGPDEQTYAQLATSIYEQGRFELWDQPNRFYTLTYPLFVGVALAYADAEAGYAVLKVMQALVMSLTAVPVYLWGRTMVSRGWALLAAALVLVIPGLAYSGLVMTEVLFLPVATLAAWASASAIARPTLGRQLLASALVLVACATRLQAMVLLPALLTAVVLKAALDRRPRDLLRFWPAALALGGAAAAWAAYRLGGGGPTSELFGAYRAAGDVSYEGWEIVRFTLWHLADAILFTGVAPTVALVLLLARWRQHDEQVRAFLAVTVSFVAWLVLLVGAFASRNVGHLAERDLLALVPLLFLALAVWLGRGAVRPRLAAAVAAALVGAVVLYLPVDRFITRSEFADAFTIVPLVHLDERWESFAPELAVTLGAALLLAAALLLPRRLLLAVPLAIAGLLVLASVSTSRSLAADSEALRTVTTGADRTWVDDLGADDVTFVWSGDLYTIVPWSLRFWNDGVRSVVKLQDTYIEGPVPQPVTLPDGQGRLLADGEPVDAPFALASSSVRLVGTEIGSGGPLSLWRIDPPLRLSHVVAGVRYDRTIDRSAQIVSYGCDGGALQFALTAHGEQLVEVAISNIVVETRELADGETWEGSANAQPVDGVCTAGLRSEGVVGVQRFELVQS